MTRLNWEKQNKLEQQKERRRRLDREKVTKAYANGAKNERERIIQLVKGELPLVLQERFIELIKGEQR